ncbi:hypothetical protein ES703_84886 [subsurface metagenome]
MFYLITPTGIDECWDEGDAYMLETRTIYNDYLHPGSRGRINKFLLSHLLRTDERWDLRPNTWCKELASV